MVGSPEPMYVLHNPAPTQMVDFTEKDKCKEKTSTSFHQQIYHPTCLCVLPPAPVDEFFLLPSRATHCWIPFPLAYSSTLLLSYLFSLLNDQFSYSSISVSQPKVIVHPPRNIWRCPGTCLVVMTSGECYSDIGGLRVPTLRNPVLDHSHSAQKYDVTSLLWTESCSPPPNSHAEALTPAIWLHLEIGSLGR